jgi:hypothetical protein
LWHAKGGKVHDWLPLRALSAIIGVSREGFADTSGIRPGQVLEPVHGAIQMGRSASPGAVIVQPGLL